MASIYLVLPVQVVLAGTRPQVDLSLGIEMVPATFSPGGRNTVKLTLRNAGPDAAGTLPPWPYTLYVVGDDADITKQPPPFEVASPVSGCAIERFVSEPLPDGRVAMTFVYYFDSVPPGQSRTCVFDVVFDPTTVASLPSRFQAFSNINDDDLNPANNRLDYVLVANSVAPAAVPVPAVSTLGLLSLLSALVLVASWQHCRSKPD